MSPDLHVIHHRDFHVTPHRGLRVTLPAGLHHPGHPDLEFRLPVVIPPVDLHVPGRADLRVILLVDFHVPKPADLRITQPRLNILSIQPLFLLLSCGLN